MAFTFGVSTQYGQSTDFLMQNFSKNSTGDVAEARDENGDVAAVTTYNEREEVSFDAVFSSTATLPTVGASITLGTDTAKYLVTSVSKSESNTDYQRVSVSATHYTANNIPAASSSN